MKSRVREFALNTLERGAQLSKYDLMIQAHCDQRTAQRVLKRLHEETLVRVVKWVSAYRQKIPVYAYGSGKDKMKPKRDEKARMRRLRADPEYAMLESMKKRRKRAVETSRIRKSTVAIGFRAEIAALAVS